MVCIPRQQNTVLTVVVDVVAAGTIIIIVIVGYLITSVWYIPRAKKAQYIISLATSDIHTYTARVFQPDAVDALSVAASK